MILDKRIPIKYWLKMIRWDLPIVLVFSTLIHFLSSHLLSIKIPISITAFLGTAIALLLSFKLNQSYERWWEARKIWGAIVNDSRTLVVQLVSFTNDNNSHIVQRMAKRQIGWCYAVGEHLRKLNPVDQLPPFLSEHEIENVKHQKHIPLALLENHSKDLSELHREQTINDFQQVQIDSTLLRLCAAMGKAERIKNTNFPKTYRITLHLFIYIFLISLSFALTEIHSIIEIPLLVIISTPFFLLEKVALSIQDPFENRPTDTSMSSISRNIEINIKQLLKETNLPEPIVSDKFYVL